MNKDWLEKRIEEKAKELTDKEYRKFINFNADNLFGRNLEIEIDGEYLPLVNYHCNYALFRDEQNENKNNKYTNYNEVYEEVFNINKKQLTDDLLSKLDSIQYLLDMRE